MGQFCFIVGSNHAPVRRIGVLHDSSSPSIAALFARAPPGDEQTSVPEHKPPIDRATPVRLTDRRLRRPFDSLDICSPVALVHKRLSPEEQQIAGLRTNRGSWLEIAGELSDTPDAVRIRHLRAIKRVTKSLDLDGVANG
jgi:hypothetical protein